MNKAMKYLLDGLYSAFSFSGKTTKITRRSRPYKSFSSRVSTNSRKNLASSVKKEEKRS